MWLAYRAQATIVTLRNCYANTHATVTLLNLFMIDMHAICKFGYKPIFVILLNRVNKV